MKKLFFILIILSTILSIGCSSSISSNDGKKREEYISEAYEWFENEVNEFNKTQVTDKIELRREDNVFIYTMPYSEGTPESEMQTEEFEGFADIAKSIRQGTVNSLSYYYDNIIENFGNDYDVILKSEKSMGGETYLIASYGKDGYVFEYDLFEKLGY